MGLGSSLDGTESGFDGTWAAVPHWPEAGSLPHGERAAIAVGPVDHLWTQASKLLSEEADS